MKTVINYIVYNNKKERVIETSDYDEALQVVSNLSKQNRLGTVYSFRKVLYEPHEIDMSDLKIFV